MKRVVSLILVLVLFTSIIGCENKTTNNKQNKVFEFGKIDSNVYTSEFSEIKFVNDDLWAFETVTQGAERGQILDMVSTCEGTNRVEVGFIKIEDSKHRSSREYLENMVNTLSDIGWEFEKIKETNFCGKEFICVNGSLNPTNYRCYVREIDDYIMYINIYACTVDVNKIESMFYEL